MSINKKNALNIFRNFISNNVLLKDMNLNLKNKTYVIFSNSIKLLNNGLVLS